MSEKWLQKYSELTEFVKRHSEIVIKSDSVSIPANIRPDFYKLFDSVRLAFLEEKYPDFIDNSDLLSTKYVEAEKIMGLSRRMFYSSDKKQSMKIFDELKIYKAKYPKLIAFFYRSLEKLFTHHKHPLIKKTNNIAENINRQLMRRFKTIESFQKLIYAENYLNLYKNYLRFKPYTDCRGSHKYKNGKSPLEVCGVVLKNKDWLYNAIAF